MNSASGGRSPLVDSVASLHLPVMIFGLPPLKLIGAPNDVLTGNSLKVYKRRRWDLRALQYLLRRSTAGTSILPILQLPLEVTIQILHYLDVRDVLALSQVLSCAVLLPSSC